jgi:hypothetical protein
MQVFWFFVILVLGIFGRVYLFDTFPSPDAQLWEEPQTGKIAYDAYQGPGFDSLTPVVTFIGEMGFHIFGFSLQRFRIIFLIFSILSIPLFFLAARLFLRNYYAAIFSTALYASSAYLLGAARIAGEWLFPVFTTCLALFSIFYAATKRSYASFALAGFTNGILMLEYYGYKIVSLFGLLFMLIYFFFDHSETSCNTASKNWGFKVLISNMPKLIVFALFFSAALLPVILANISNPLYPFAEGYLRHKTMMELKYSSMTLADKLAEHAHKVSDASQYLFMKAGGKDLLPPTMGAIEYFTGLLGVVALAYCAVSCRRTPAKMYLVLTIVITVILSGVLAHNPSRYRLISLIPVYLLAIGVFIDDFSDSKPRFKKIFLSVMFVILAGLIAINLYNFFVVAVHDQNVQDDMYDKELNVVNAIIRVQKQYPETITYLFSNYNLLEMANDYYWMYDYTKVKVINSTVQLENATGYLLAHDSFINSSKSYARAHDCEQWKTRFERNEILLCKVD